MNCNHCGHLMHEETVSICLCDMDPVAKIMGVPASVCPHCGNRVYSEETMERLDSIRDNFGSPTRVEPLYVYEFDEPIAASQDITPIVTTSGAVFGAAIDLVKAS